MDLKDWINTIPVVTRHWFLGTLIVPLLGRLGLVSAQWMYLDWDLIVNKFHFWRPITALIFYPVTPQTGFHWLMMLYFLYNYSKNLESDTFSGRPADYLYCLLINWFVCVGLCLAFGVYFMLEPMVISVLYVWCMINKDTIVSFWFGMRFPARYLPWVLCIFNMVLRNGGLNELIGIVSGHAYYFFALQYPLEHGGIQLIQTPAFLYQLLPNNEGGVHSMNGPEFARGANARRGHAWGQGVQLGGQ
ncbi:unnamed protein product [Caenorhabditis angaria]|uniref:Derlin n=1 Tax=Caenorhabditis angaria TaxID=860376 RepID=A0A9P1MX71_9PELO|nr:unnamed protein product [Caenorhabditis angaria]